MKLSALRIFLLILMTVGLVMISRVSAVETAGTDFDEIKVSIEKAPLPQEKKTSLLKRASDAVNAGIPSADVAVIVKRGLARGMDSKGIEDFIGMAVKSKEQNLPVRPVLDRVQQGLSKGVSPERITTATKQLVEKLAAADTIVNNLERSGIKADKQTEKGGAVHTVARALERSVPEETITKMGLKAAKQGASLSRFDAAVSSMTSFVEMGMSVDNASKLIDKAMDKRYSEKEMMGMEREMSYMMREGWMMDDAMKSIETMMNKGFTGDMHKGMGTGPSPGPGTGMGGTPSMPAAPGGGMHRWGPGMGRH